jgi:rRNA processing protein Krr1/Pno1
VRTGGDEGATGEIWKKIESAKTVSIYLSFQNYKMNITVSNKCYDNFEYISIMNLQSTTETKGM